MRKVAIGSDHAGFALKSFIVNNVTEVEFVDIGVFSEQKSDYPDQAQEVAKLVLERKTDFGILICGTGVGMAIAANRYKGIRAVNAQSGFVASMARKHNDANLLTIGSRVIAPQLALHIVKVFLFTPFEGGRHLKRIEKLDKLG